jgi:hypothetical protein
MFEKRYTYRTGPSLRNEVYASDELTELAEQIVRAEQEAGFNVGILNDRGVLTVVRSSETQCMAMSSLTATVGRARQDYFARAGTLSGDCWAFAPSTPDRDVILAMTSKELARDVAAKYIGGLSIRVERDEVDVAVEDIVNGRLYHGGRQLHFDEPLYDGAKCAFESATLWFTVVDRAVRNCKAYDHQIRRTMLDNTYEVIQYLTHARGNVGVVVGVEKNALDDRGSRQELVAIIDVGNAQRRLPVAGYSRERLKDRIANAISLVGKDVEFAEAPDGFVLDEVPDFARGMSEATGSMARGVDVVVAR